MKETLTNANFPQDAEGHVYHIHVKRGQVANRILTVGDHLRARAIAKHLDHIDFEHSSQRGFLTITGRYKDIPVSIMAIGMGNPMMDFLVRETRAVVDGDIAIIRFGSCGSLTERAPPGSVIVPKGGYCIRRNIDYFCDTPLHSGIQDMPYLISGTFAADPGMTELLEQTLTKAMAEHQEDIKIGPVIGGGLNADGCSFYSAQGRLDPQFWDDNTQVIDTALASHPTTDALEMETSMLFHLAHCSKGTVRAAGCMQVFADRVHNGFIRPEVVAVLEPLVGKAVLDALVLVEIEAMNEVGTVWEKKMKV
ncbi:nucleoside phosphorylase domain-containing protein [Halteromyces radiatus]|uniref:nucleoside phosphorylase domain-containing protein n=1 Tax=Halteromyces radiatus TaxID=101107 RepID=UPI00221EAA34|nr:nucleoside phosphorylase domain-containing protein [Halteromyces radiatus]KAI8084911.1 nucleoside phosphorylase domain-containing protein [Halteromyces radiatus]